MGLVRARPCNLAAAVVLMVGNYQSGAAYLIGVNYVPSFLRLDIFMYHQTYNFDRRVCVQSVSFSGFAKSRKKRLPHGHTALT